MRPRCEAIDSLLLEGDPASLEAAARHAATCAECAETLAAWNEISETAQTMKATWRNDMLWPRIYRALATEKHAAARRSPVWQIAAAVVLTVGLAGGTWYAQQNRAEKEFRKRIMTMSALDEVQKAEDAHKKAILQLEDLAEAKLEQTQSPLMISYKEKLMMLDDAIADCEANIERNRQNAFLRRQLMVMYSEKQQTLQDVLQERSDVSNP